MSTYASGAHSAESMRPRSGHRTIPIVKRRGGPGLKKTRSLPLVERRTVELWRGTDYRWRELFETADVVSEGAIRHEQDEPIYYGSTSVLLTAARIGAADVDEVQRLITRDPHCRLRAVRIACLEAELRARAPLGRVHAELCVRRDRRGVRIDVDVEAKVLGSDAQPRSRTRDPSRG